MEDACWSSHVPPPNTQTQQQQQTLLLSCPFPWFPSFLPFWSTLLWFPVAKICISLPDGFLRLPEPTVLCKWQPENAEELRPPGAALTQRWDVWNPQTHSSFSSPHRFWELPSKTEFSYTQWKFLIASYIWVTFFSCFAFPLPIVVSWNYLQNKLFEVKSLFQGLLLGKVEQWHIYSQT